MRRVVLVCLLLGAATVAYAQGPEWVYGDGPFESGSVIAAQPNGSIYSVREGYLLISWNDGRTWDTRSDDAINPRELRILSPQSMLALGETRVIRSDNNGTTWMSAGLDGIDLYDLAVGSDGTWYAATDERLYKSENEGDTWELLPSDYNSGEFRTLLVDVMVSEDNSILVTWLRDYSVGCVFPRRSEDAGHTWQDAVGAGCTSGRSMVRTSNGELFIPSYDPSHELPGIPSNGLFHSTDNGATWDEIYEHASTGGSRTASGQLLIGRPGGIEWSGPALPVAAVASFVETPGGTLFANSGGYGTYGIDPPSFSYQGSGSYRLDVGASHWEQSGNRPASIQALEVSSLGDIHVGTSRFLAKEEGGAWAASGWNVEVNDLLALDDGRLLIASPAPHTGGELGSGVPLLNNTFCAYDCGVSSLAVTASETLVASAYTGIYAQPEHLGIYRSVDDGESWSIVLPDIGNVRSLYASEEGLLLAGTYGEADRNNPGVGLYRSDDDGQTWTAFVAGLTNTEVRSVFSSSGQEYVGTEDGVFTSFAGGPWSADGLPGDTVYAFIDAADGLLAGTSSGVFRRTAPGVWEAYGTGLEDRSILGLLVTQLELDELIVVGTDAGVYLSRPGLITVGQEQPARPGSATHFYPPFPNPAHDIVTLRFDLDQDSLVRIRAFDTLGREVDQPVDAHFQSGSHQTEWHVSGLASGVYLLRIEAGDMHSTQRVIVLR